MFKIRFAMFQFPMALMLLTGVLFPTSGMTSEAKQAYLSADACYKKLRHSSIKQKYASEWMNCISKYKNVYKAFPYSAWAPAGMYKAAQLYQILARKSGNPVFKNQVADLLTQLRNEYPQSAYAQKATALLKRLKIKPKPTAEMRRHKKSKKRLTLNDDLMKSYMRSKKEKITYVKSAPEKIRIKPRSKPATREIGRVTDLRFWSNPEYTRIVVNADQETDYSHRLLRKDTQINMPFQRLYIDIEKTRLDENVSDHVSIDDNLLKQARAGQYLPRTVRVVVDIKSFEDYKIFSLKDPFRIVIDVWGKDSDESLVSLQKTTGLDKKKKLVKTKPLTTDNLKSSDIARQLALGVQTIVLDPGHGGSDPGASGYYKNVWEKDIVLKLAKKLAVILQNRLKCNVSLTRSTDKKLTLEERTAIANTRRADLFISLHCNAAKNTKLKGLETYFLNLATDAQAIAVAARENATSEKNISDLDFILKDLMNHAKIEESTRLAEIVHKSFFRGMREKFSGINNLGVKQAPFYVLLGARMPSILIETSFISHKTECRRIMTNEYQTAICNSIANGIEKYIDETNPKFL